MITVWGRATSSNVQKVMWTIGELGLAHKRIDVGGKYGGLDTPEYRAMNPHGVIPTIEMDGYVMWESNAIVRHLASLDPSRRLWPAEPAASGAADMWAEWSSIYVQRPVTALFWAVVRTRPSEHDANKIAAAKKEAYGALAKANAVLETRDFLAGDTLSIADINFGHTLYRYHEMEIDRPDLPGVAAYYARLSTRPAYNEHVKVDFSSLRVTD